MKKALSLLLSVIMILSALPLTAVESFALSSDVTIRTSELSPNEALNLTADTTLIVDESILLYGIFGSKYNLTIQSEGEGKKLYSFVSADYAINVKSLEVNAPDLEINLRAPKYGIKAKNTIYVNVKSLISNGELYSNKDNICLIAESVNINGANENGVYTPNGHVLIEVEKDCTIIGDCAVYSQYAPYITANDLSIVSYEGDGIYSEYFGTDYIDTNGNVKSDSKDQRSTTLNAKTISITAGSNSNADGIDSRAVNILGDTLYIDATNGSNSKGIYSHSEAHSKVNINCSAKIESNSIGIDVENEIYFESYSSWVLNHYGEYLFVSSKNDLAIKAKTQYIREGVKNTIHFNGFRIVLKSGKKGVVEASEIKTGGGNLTQYYTKLYEDDYTLVYFYEYVSNSRLMERPELDQDFYNTGEYITASYDIPVWLEDYTTYCAVYDQQNNVYRKIAGTAGNGSFMADSSLQGEYIVACLDYDFYGRTNKYYSNVSKVRSNLLTISFDANGGTGTMSSVTVDEDEPYALPKCTFTPPSGKEFDYWTTDTVNGENTIGGTGYKIKVNRDTVLSPVWRDAVENRIYYQSKGVPALSNQWISYDYDKDGRKFFTVNSSGEYYTASSSIMGTKQSLYSPKITLPEGQCKITFKAWDKVYNTEFPTEFSVYITKDWRDSITSQDTVRISPEKVYCSNDNNEYTYQIPSQFYGEDVYFEIRHTSSVSSKGILFISDFAVWEMPLSITNTLLPPTFEEGGTLTLSVNVEGGSPPYYYDWYYHDGRYGRNYRYSSKGITSNTDTLTFTMSSENEWADSYTSIYCAVTDEDGTTVSSNDVQIVPQPVIPSTVDLTLYSSAIAIPGNFADISDITRATNTYFTISQSESCWIDAETGYEMTSQDRFGFAKPYILKLTLQPYAAYYFSDDLTYSPVTIQVSDTDSTNLMTSVYQEVDDNGRIVVYLLPKQNYVQNSYVGYKLPDERTISVFRNYGANFFTLANPSYANKILSKVANYSQYSYLNTPDYYCSIDGVNWYNSAAINGVGIGYSQPGVYTAMIKVDDDIIYEQNVDTNVVTGYYFETNPFWSTSGNRWRNIDGDSNGFGWMSNSEYAYEGSGYIYSASNSSGTSDRVISPLLNPNSEGRTNISFFAKGLYDEVSFKVYIFSDSSSAVCVSGEDVIETGTEGYTRYIYDVTDYIPVVDGVKQQFSVIFVGISHGDSDNGILCIDQFQLFYDTVSPYISLQPKDAYSYVGGEASFNVGVTGGTSPFAYTWESSTDCVAWTPVGGNSDTLSFTVATSDIEKYYRCTVTDADGFTFTSKTARLFTPITIIRQPEDVIYSETGDNSGNIMLAGGKSENCYCYYLLKATDDGGDFEMCSIIDENTSKSVSFDMNEYELNKQYRILVSDTPYAEIDSDSQTVLSEPFYYRKSNYSVYDLKVLGTQVTSENTDDILGDGVFSYTAKTKTLTVYTNNEVVEINAADSPYLIENHIDGLTVDVEYYSRFSGYVTIKTTADMTIKNELLEIQSDNDYAIEADGCTLTFDNSDSELSARKNAIHGTNGARLCFDYSWSVLQSETGSAIDGFDNGSPEFELCEITSPENAVVSGGNIYESNGTTPASHVEINAFNKYGLSVAGVPVHDHNYSDILGDGVFSYNSSTNTLTVNGNCDSDECIIENDTVNGLIINVASDSVFTSSSGYGMILRSSTTITGPGKLTLDDSEIYARSHNGVVRANITFDDIDLDISGEFCIDAWGDNEVLTINNSNINATAIVSAISGFNDVVVTNCSVIRPVGGVLDNGTVYDSDGVTEAMNVVISTSGLLYDINEDGVEDINDIAFIISASVGEIEMTASQSAKADLNGDNVVDGFDAAYLDRIFTSNNTNRGDVNQDGEINEVDYAMVKSHLSGVAVNADTPANLLSTDYLDSRYNGIKTQYPAGSIITQQYYNADMDSDKAVDAFDLFYIDKCINNLV